MCPAQLPVSLPSSSSPPGPCHCSVGFRFEEELALLPGSCRTKREWRPVLALGPWGTILSPPEGLETAEFLSQPPEASAAVPCQPVSPRGQREWTPLPATWTENDGGGKDGRTVSPWIWILKVGSLPKDWVLGVGGEQVAGLEAGRHGGRSPHHSCEGKRKEAERRKSHPSTAFSIGTESQNLPVFFNKKLVSATPGTNCLVAPLRS